MNCSKAQALLSQYLDLVLADAERSELETHLPGCVACQAECDALSETITGISSLSKIDPPVGFSTAVMARIKEQEHKPSFFETFWGAFKMPLPALGLLLLSGLAFLLYRANPIEEQATQSLEHLGEKTLDRKVKRQQDTQIQAQTPLEQSSLINGDSDSGPSEVNRLAGKGESAVVAMDDKQEEVISFLPKPGLQEKTIRQQIVALAQRLSGSQLRLDETLSERQNAELALPLRLQLPKSTLKDFKSGLQKWGRILPSEKPRSEESKQAIPSQPFIRIVVLISIQ